MKNTIIQRLQSAWNVFLDRNPLDEVRNVGGAAYSLPNHRTRFQRGGNEKSIVGAIYNRCSIDVAATNIRHVRTNQDGIYLETINSGLNNCLSTEANIDQTGRSFIQDVVISMFDEGVVAIVPTDTSVSLVNENSFDILTLRTARIIQWYPAHVRLLIYNDNRGEKEEITLPKSKVAIIENPLYAVMNERNSILQRLISKLNLLDAIDEASGSGKLDIIIQLPYTVKSETRKKQAEDRRKTIEDQLVGSKYGIAYADATERITQLNRPAENQLMERIEYLTRMLYSQLGISEAILDGTADEKELLNYYNRTIEPITSSITEEMSRKFLTKTARTQGQKIKHFRNIFSIVTPERLADLADKLTRNEIASPNDMRAVIGWTPSTDPEADQLRNRNISQPQPEGLDVTGEFDKAKQKNDKEIQNGR